MRPWRPSAEPRPDYPRQLPHPADTPSPPASASDRRRNGRARDCTCGKESRAPCRSHDNDRCKVAGLISCRWRTRSPVAPGWRGSPARTARSGGRAPCPDSPHRSPTCGADGRCRCACGGPGRRGGARASGIDTAGLVHTAFPSSHGARSPAGPSVMFAGQDHGRRTQRRAAAARRRRATAITVMTDWSRSGRAQTGGADAGRPTTSRPGAGPLINAHFQLIANVWMIRVT